jgi:hypothetical protein
MKSKFEVGKWYWCTTPPALELPNKLGFYLSSINGNVATLYAEWPKFNLFGKITGKGIIAEADSQKYIFHFLPHHVYYPERKGLDRFGVER